MNSTQNFFEGYAVCPHSLQTSGRQLSPSFCCTCSRQLLAQNGHAVVTRRYALPGVEPTCRVYEYTP
jgi:hypothetical protein